MPELHDRPLGTSSENRVLYALQETGSRLIGDRFLADYLASCLEMVSGFGSTHQIALAAEGLRQGRMPDLLKVSAARAKENIDWATQNATEKFHRTNVLAFLSLWAAQEAGCENIIAAILGSVHTAAALVANQFKPGKCDISSWPWTDERCLQIANDLNSIVGRQLSDRGDAAERLVKTFGCLGVRLALPPAVTAKFNEASMVRNVLLHRYGRLSPRDITKAPHLAEHSNNAIQITQKRLSEYYESVIAVHLAIDEAIFEKGWK